MLNYSDLDVEQVHVDRKRVDELLTPSMFFENIQIFSILFRFSQYYSDFLNIIRIMCTDT
jgi:hypothetical protein